MATTSIFSLNFSFPRSSVGMHTLTLQRQVRYTGRWSVQNCIPMLEHGNERTPMQEHENERNLIVGLRCLARLNKLTQAIDIHLLNFLCRGNPLWLSSPYENRYFKASFLRKGNHKGLPLREIIYVKVYTSFSLLSRGL